MTSPSASSALLAVGGKSRSSAGTQTGGRLRPFDNLIRAATAMVAGTVRAGGAEAVMRKSYAGDTISPLVLRAAVSPSTFSDWATLTALGAATDLIDVLRPASAAGQLIRAGLQLSFQNGSITVPSAVASAANASFVAESAPIPVRAISAAGPTLTPKKIAAITAFTGEVARHTALEPIIRATLVESMAAGLDAAMFSTAAATAAAPAGLRNGVAATAATAGGGDAAMIRDLGNLAAAVAPVAGSQIVFVASAGEATKIMLRSNPAFPFTILASSGLPAGVVMAIAPAALVSVIAPLPELEASRDATLHMEDTSPLNISTAGSPNTVAAPVRSAFQTDTIMLRVVLQATWALRSTSAVAWTSGVSW